MSHYSKEPFIVYDCAATTEQTLERELFGTEAAPGLFVEAGSGTLVLDNIDCLPHAALEPLLGILRHGELVREGSGRRIAVGCRIAALTEKDVNAQALRAALGEDLYTSLTELNLTVPPLRDRKDDLLLLTRYFLKVLSKRTGRRISGASMPVQNLFLKYDWPGNIGELQTLLEKVAATASESFIGIDDLPEEFAKLAQEDSERGLVLDDIIRGHIRMVYDLCKQDMDGAAELLGIRTVALKKKLESYQFI
jgi:DNA-binding NtrC family response regulator